MSSPTGSSPVVDAQVHVWLPEAPDRPWPPGGAERARSMLRHERITGPGLRAEMREAGVDRAVLVPPFFEGHRSGSYAELVRLFREDLDCLSPADVDAVLGRSVSTWLGW